MDITCMYLRVSISYILQRSRRVKEEIEMLYLKLKHIDKGIAFSGRRAKTARSQGKKVQITVKQEISRWMLHLLFFCFHTYYIFQGTYMILILLSMQNTWELGLGLLAAKIEEHYVKL